MQNVPLDEFSRYQYSQGFHSLSLFQPYDLCLFSYSKSVVSDESRQQQVALSSVRGVILNDNVHAIFTSRSSKWNDAIVSMVYHF